VGSEAFNARPLAKTHGKLSKGGSGCLIWGQKKRGAVSKKKKGESEKLIFRERVRREKKKRNHRARTKAGIERNSP